MQIEQIAVSFNKQEPMLRRRSPFPPLPSFPSFVVFLICGDPVGRKSLLCGGYIDLPITDHITHQPFEPIFRLGIPCFFYASSRLWPEIGWVVRADQAKQNKVVDLVVTGAFLPVIRIVLKSRPAARKTSDPGALWRVHTRHRGPPSLLNLRSNSCLVEPQRHRRAR